ncbi:MAG: hypothetical protein ABIG28_01905 [archaeon]
MGTLKGEFNEGDYAEQTFERYVRTRGIRFFFDDETSREFYVGGDGKLMTKEEILDSHEDNNPSVAEAVWCSLRGEPCVGVVPRKGGDEEEDSFKEILEGATDYARLRLPMIG